MNEEEKHPFRSIRIESLRVTWRERWTRWLSFVTVVVVAVVAGALGWMSGAIAGRQQCAKERAEETCFRHATIAADVSLSTANDSTYIRCKDAASSSSGGGSVILNGQVIFENSSINAP